jgi:hypothetical protein
MSKFFSNLFRNNSSSGKRSGFGGSQSAINDSSRQGAASSSMRSAQSLDNLTSYHVTQKELEKYKLHKASWEGNLEKVGRLARPGQIDSRDQHFRVIKLLYQVR